MAAKGKSNNPDLGGIECDGCGGFAAIRRKSTGRRLLYEHCPNCGMNQKSGEKLQAKWEKAIANPISEQVAINTEIKPVHNTVAPAEKVNAEEWQPAELKQEIERIKNENATTRTAETAKRISNETDTTGTSIGGAKNGFACFAFGLFAGIAAIAGVRAKA